MDSTPESDGNPFADIPTRPMRVKVLYTFDTNNKTTCLARFPDTLQIPAVPIDDNSQVGVIELGQCLESIVSASPELVSQLSEGDFTIYAYDYSEYETPLVGQGMLSAALAAASIAPFGPPQQSKTMITGRVCQNVPALFSNGVKETLEVKLRLVPVAKQAHNEYNRRVDSYRSTTPATSAGFDPNAWNTSLHQGRAQQTPSDYIDFNTNVQSSQQNQALIDDIFGLGSASSGEGGGQQGLAGVGIHPTPTDSIFGPNPAFAAHSHSAPGSRAGSPMIGSESSIRNEQLRHQSFSANGTNFADQSRPGSRASTRSELAPSQHRRPPLAPSQSFSQASEYFYGDDGQPRKRAKVTQTDWRGRSSFGKRTVDLRVTAATAASMEMHRPVPVRPSAPGSNLEPPPRVPTPVPQLKAGSAPHGRPSIGSKSLLRQASTVDSDFMSDIDQMSEAIASSPEDDSPGRSLTAEGTPQDIPSSPPIFPGMSFPQPSSPGLPAAPSARNADSGYMSERNFDSNGIFDSDNADNEDRSPDAQDLMTVQQHRSRKQQSQPFIKSEWPTNAGFRPTDFSDPSSNTEQRHPNMQINVPNSGGQETSQVMRPLHLPPSQRPSRANSPLPPLPQARHDGMGASLSRRSSLALPNMPLQSFDPSQKAANKKPQPSYRSRPDCLESEAGSPAPSDNEGRPSGPRRSGSGAPRRKVIERRLQTAVAKGEMPQYCTHCGAIETPTWRRLYVKHVNGKPSTLDFVEGEGEAIGVEIVERNDETGEPTKFVIRKTMKKTKDSHPGKDFVDTQVCNPCGLWFTKTRKMRPPEKWGRKSGTRRSKREMARLGEASDATDGLEPQSEAFFTDAMGPEDGAEDQSGASVGQTEADSSQGSAEPFGGQRTRSLSMECRQTRRSSDGPQWNVSRRNAAAGARATRSSPACLSGTVESPIELDDKTPMPTRRLLFPSPRQIGETKTLDNGDTLISKSLSPAQRGSTAEVLAGKIPAVDAQTDVSIFEAFTIEKENVASSQDGDDDLAHLFNGSPTDLFKTPGRTPTKRSPGLLQKLFKTPTSASRKRKPLSPNRNAANNAHAHANVAVNDFMTSPLSSRYFLRSTPTRLANTPGRQSQNSGRRGGNQMASPFSRHLADLLNNPNDPALMFNSPGRDFGFGELPTFTTPGRQIDWDGLDQMMSSEFGMEQTFAGEDFAANGSDDSQV